MAMITKMAKNEPKTISIFFWPFCGFGSSTGCMRPVSHPPSGARRRGRHTTPAGPTREGQPAVASSSTVRSRPARKPTTICGTIRAAMRAIGTPQPPLCW